MEMAPRALFAAVFAASLVAAGASASLWAKDPLKLVVDQARIVRLTSAADTVIIGNPMIADATVRDARTLIITGRTFGTTNLIVLDYSGQQIAEELLTVESGDTQLVTLFKLDNRQTYSCSPVCEPALTVGDSEKVFSDRKSQITDHNALAQGGAGN